MHCLCCSSKLLIFALLISNCGHVFGVFYFFHVYTGTTVQASAQEEGIEGQEGEGKEVEEVEEVQEGRC